MFLALERPLFLLLKDKKDQKEEEEKKPGVCLSTSYGLVVSLKLREVKTWGMSL